MKMTGLAVYLAQYTNRPHRYKKKDKQKKILDESSARVQSSFKKRYSTADSP